MRRTTTRCSACAAPAAPAAPEMPLNSASVQRSTSIPSCVLQAAGADVSDDDELFRVRGASGGSAGNAAEDAEAALDAVDSSRPGGAAAADVLQRWDADGAAEALRDRFVTGEFFRLRICRRQRLGRCVAVSFESSTLATTRGSWPNACSQFASLSGLHSEHSNVVSGAGDWEAAQRREDAEPGADDGDDAFGEFEDIETGEL